MAVTGFWPIYGNLKATLDYADNPDKTTPKECLDKDLYSALRYAENDNKTDRQVFVGGINCSAQNAYTEMIAVQLRFGMKGKVVAYHGIQSFKANEVTPEEAFEIGKETARKMWGCGSPVETSDCSSNQKHRPSRQARHQYQVLVTVHLNTDNLHCHFVVNPCSFKNGAKFKNKISDHLELRKVSDEVCREHGLSVLVNSNFYSKGQKKEYWAHRNGQMTHRDMLKKDIDYCLQYSSNGSEFERQLWGLGYSIDWRRLSIKHKGWDRAVRLKSIGITETTLEACFSKNKDNYHFYDEWNTHLPYKAKQAPIIKLINQLDYTVDHAKDPSRVLVSAVFYIILSLFEIAKTVKNFVIADVELRHEVRNVKKYVSEYRFLQAEKLNTMTDIKNYIDTTKAEINKFERSRALTDNKRRRAKTPEEKQQYKDERKVITERITTLRKKLNQAEQIYNKSPRLIDLLGREYQIERKTYERTK